MAGIEVHGAVDDRTRCPHWDSLEDVVAFRFRCCGEWYPCRACHDERVDHPTEVWGPGQVDEHAVLCGVCRRTMTIDTYVSCQHVCPFCGASFNPGCRDHWGLYFETDG